MVRFIKLILFLLLVTSFHSITDNDLANDLVVSSNTVVSAVTQSPGLFCVNSAKIPHLPDAELNINILHPSEAMSSRVQRTSLNGSAFTSKTITQILAERQAMLLKHWKKFYDGSALLSITRPACDYYVFTLRQIII